MIAQHVKEFSKNAYRYDEHTALQQTIAQYLLNHVTSHPSTVLDLGCGSGAIYKQLPWHVQQFTGIDCARGMCDLHPQDTSVNVICDDFENASLWNAQTYDLIISSSALQWATALEGLIQEMAASCKEGAFAIFCDKTFETLYTLSKLPTFLPNAEHLKSLFSEHFDAHYEVKRYQLTFDSPRDIFAYIKKSGVSGGQRRLSFCDTKRIMQEYPHHYLEFEVLFVWGSSKKYNAS